MSKVRPSFVVLFLFCSFLLAGCASSQTEPAYSGPQTPCSTLYLYAPANFVIDLAAGDTVRIDSAAGEFPVFCSAKEAKEALQQGLDSGIIRRGDWKVYRLNGGFAELGKATAPNRYVLALPAKMVGWE